MFEVHLNTTSTKTKTSTRTLFQAFQAFQAPLRLPPGAGPNAMAGYPSLEQLQQEVIEAAKRCSCEASLRQALERLQAPAMLGAEGSGMGRGWLPSGLCQNSY